jgi:glucose/arabinose dehydrogenase
MKKRNVVLIIISIVLIIGAVLAYFWVKNNTSILTTKIPESDLVSNNLNTESKEAFKLYETEIDGKKLNLPEGFSVNVFARDIGSARFMSSNENNVIFVGTKDNDKIYALKDYDNDGVAEQKNIIDKELNKPHSVFYFEGDLYLGEENRVSVYRDINDDGTFSAKEILVDNLPSGNRLTGGGHNTRTVVIGPDRKMYVSIGSTCNVCEEDDDRRATIMRYNLDGSDEEIYATGLRNTVGYLFDGDEIIGVDMGRDQIGDDIPPEEINIIEQGKDYGWPYCYGDNVNNPEYPDRSSYCANETEAPVFNMQAHSAPLGISMLNESAKSTWPAEYSDGYFIAFHGSWNRTIPTGYKVVFVDKSDGEYKQYNFISGWLEENAQSWGRPVAMTFDSKGNMYLSDDKTGSIYKISYESKVLSYSSRLPK